MAFISKPVEHQSLDQQTAEWKNDKLSFTKPVIDSLNGISCPFLVFNTLSNLSRVRF